MADLTAQAYEVLGSQPPPGHELLSTVVLHLTPPGGTAATGAGVMFGAVGGKPPQGFSTHRQAVKVFAAGTTGNWLPPQVTVYGPPVHELEV